MGQFSWLDCISGKQIVDDKVKDVYVLVPKEFGGGHIVEHCYDGYGNFGGYDIFDLVATWNREALADKPNFIFPYALERAKRLLEHQQRGDSYSESIELQLKDKPWFEFYSDLDFSEDEVVEYMKECCGRWHAEWRLIGISLSCYDEDNEVLPFPIKITYDSHACYELCEPSKSDPNQGWECEEDDDDWEEEQYWTVEDEEAKGY